MDKRINAAAAAFPKLEPVIQGFIQRSLPAELTCTEEEIFYDARNRDVYVALSFEARLDGAVFDRQLIVHCPFPDGKLEILDQDSLIERDLEDITHIIPLAVLQALKNEVLNLNLIAALTTSSLLLDKTCHPGTPKI